MIMMKWQRPLPTCLLQRSPSPRRLSPLTPPPTHTHTTRWHNHLNPEIKRGEWTREEDEMIVRFHRKKGNQVRGGRAYLLCPCERRAWSGTQLCCMGHERSSSGMHAGQHAGASVPAAPNPPQRSPRAVGTDGQVPQGAH